MVVMDGKFVLLFLPDRADRPRRSVGVNKLGWKSKTEWRSSSVVSILWWRVPGCWTCLLYSMISVSIAGCDACRLCMDYNWAARQAFSKVIRF